MNIFRINKNLFAVLSDKKGKWFFDDWSSPSPNTSPSDQTNQSNYIRGRLKSSTTNSENKEKYKVYVKKSVLIVYLNSHINKQIFTLTYFGELKIFFQCDVKKIYLSFCIPRTTSSLVESFVQETSKSFLPKDHITVSYVLTSL